LVVPFSPADELVLGMPKRKPTNAPIADEALAIRREVPITFIGSESLQAIDTINAIPANINRGNAHCQGTIYVESPWAVRGRLVETEREFV